MMVVSLAKSCIAPSAVFLAMFKKYLSTLEVKEVDLIKEVANWKIDHQVYGMDQLLLSLAKDVPIMDDRPSGLDSVQIRKPKGKLHPAKRN